MLEFLDNEGTGDGEHELDLGDALQDESIGDDIEASYVPEYSPIAFVDPGLLIALASLKKEDVITREEAREALGLEA